MQRQPNRFGLRRRRSYDGSVLPHPILERFASTLQRPGAEVLVLASPERAAHYRAHVRHARVLDEAMPLDEMDRVTDLAENVLDLAIVDGLLEHEPWDRWLLQRLHRALRVDAPVVLLVPPLVSLASIADSRFLAYAAAKVRERLSPGSAPRAPVRRRYGFGALARKLESVGFAAIERGPGWLAHRATAVARKAVRFQGAHGRWPDPGEAHRRHAREYASTYAAGEAWLARFPEMGAPRARPLDPSEWREASVLVLSPHPDDELIGCGGTLCRLASAGARIAIVQATDGSKLRSLLDLPSARRKSVRLDEARRVADALGAGLLLWQEEDGSLRCSPETTRRLASLLDELKPACVFTPFLGDSHADHRALSCILGRALRRSIAQPEVLQYEVWGVAPANAYCDIARQAARLERLLFLYERAMRADDFVYFCESRSLARGVDLTARPAYVEAFLRTSAAAYAALVDRMSPEELGEARRDTVREPALARLRRTAS